MTAAFALFVAIAAGQVIAQTATYPSDLPACAQQPVAQVINHGRCDTLDIDCICADHGLLREFGASIVADCNEADMGLALGVVAEICVPFFGSTSVGADEQQPHSTTATVSVPGLTTTFLMGPRPTSVTPSFPFSTVFQPTEVDDQALSTTTATSEQGQTSSTSIDIITDTNVLIMKVPTGSTTSINFSRTLTYSTTSSRTSTGGGSPGITRLMWMSLGMVVMGVVFAEL